MPVNYTISYIQSRLGFRNIAELGTRYFYKDTPQGRVFLLRNLEEYLVCPLPQILAACIALEAGAPKFTVLNFVCDCYELYAVRPGVNPIMHVEIFNFLWMNQYHLRFENAMAPNIQVLVTMQITHSTLEKLSKSSKLREIFGFKE